MSNFFKKLIVEPHSKVKLKHFDPGSHGKYRTEEETVLETQKYLDAMGRLQDLMYSENKHSLLIVIQGMDTAGKDGVIRHALRGFNPQGCMVASFKQPTPEESEHDFLWRIHPHAPRKGRVSIFNRSHYESVLVERVHKLVPDKIWEGRYDRINHFEKLLSVENKTLILKFFLHISKEEQLNRFEKRLSDPARQWKISDSDYKEREFWEGYTEAFETLLSKTSTEIAPWFIIPSDHKWYRDLAVSQIVVNTLEKIGMKPPTPTVDIGEIRRKYHEETKK